ncbi:tRNA epoxyqueuosine(34) reductase QueG [Candidatus Woesearchaeota archaeon]|nr:tRNA epoxyqueuosine(34) reductase QueG [Candidatus Woesearchaeota archaeon]
MVHLKEQIRDWGQALGFQQVGISDIDLGEASARFREWLAAGWQGSMTWMADRAELRLHPDALVPGTLRVISVRMDYLPESRERAWMQLLNPDQAYISRYALGRDYHKLIRKRLQQLADRIRRHVADTRYRVFCDSAPVLEKPLASQAGLGWIGKHTNLIHHEDGSFFFIGEIYTDLPLPVDQPATVHCGSCTACMDVCPTQAIVAPYRLDARRCIAYLTIEWHGVIPEAFRPAMGNRIYGCDDCQLVCPWNRYARMTREIDFMPRHGLDTASLLSLWAWSEDLFLRQMEGSAIRRIGYQSWLRNIAVALGNAPASALIATALQSRLEQASPLLKTHILWSLERHITGK